MNTKLIRWIGLAGTIVLIGCGEAGPSEQPPAASLATPIINGNPPNAPMHDAVVALHQRYGDSVSASPFCSGTLITPTVVLTAAHCLDVASAKKPQFATMAPIDLAIYVGDGIANDPSPALFPVSETKIHESYDRIALLNDIALVRLPIAVPTSLAEPIAPLPPNVGFTQNDIGSLKLNFAGFGVDEKNNAGVKLQVDGTLGGLGCTVSGCYGADDPATQISYAQPHSGPCFGDSGGPAFLSRNGTPYVGGVTSWGDPNCSQFGVSTRVDAFGGWIGAFAGVEPAPDCGADGQCNAACEAGMDPDCGSPDPEPAACGDGICGAGESCDGRDGTVECTSDCPEGKGKPSTRYCYVEGVCQGPGC